VPMEIGGGFGGKVSVYLEPVAALLSKKTGHPVKIVMTRQEEFEGSGPTAGSYVRVKMGATNDGKITAAQVYLAYEAGAYPGSPVGAGAMCVFAAYDIPNVVIDGYDVVVNKPKTSAYRAPGAPNAAFAAEQVVGELAERLELDPIDFRLRNAAKEGTRRADGPIFQRIGCVEVLEAMRGHHHYNTPLEGPNRGRGVSIGFWMNGGLDSSCNIAVNADGTVSLVEGSTDIGGSRAAIAMQAAEVLGIPAEDVRPTVADTDSVGYTAVTGGSRVTFATGWAAYEAAQDVKRQMIDRAAAIWEVGPEIIELDDGVFQSKEDTELKMTFKDLAGQLSDTGGPIVGRATVKPRGAGGSFSGNIVDVEVDPETGKVQVLRYTAVQDVGKAIHPGYVEGQVQGGVCQGIGWALSEEYV
ncbi:MAG: molybdopterin-dependent oxidoreductase, partial [Dehalococcoidia bacterium]|nr:molybdopterin-dependent oxidoreductase [Dehalococcoidia bacterium]